MTENEFLLQDRITKIKSINEQHNLLDNSYLSFSGGKDSTVLHYLLDVALPENKIPRVFINTGIEYNSVVAFVKQIQKNDNRIVVIQPSKNIKETLEIYGYPFKSKEYSQRLAYWKAGHRADYMIKWANGEKFISCPKKLRYQLEESFTLNVSDKCCTKLKKEPAFFWSKENNRPIAITGMRKEEGGNRKTMSCITTKNDKVVKFHPLAPIPELWEDWFVKKYKIELCELYYPPYNFTRTGCKGCPFAIDIQKELDVMEKYLPAEKKQCELIWKPVYDEYRKIGYRLNNK